MGCNSAIYTVNQIAQEIATTAGTFVQVPFGSVIRRFGKAFMLDGAFLNCQTTGYFKVDAIVTATPTATGTMTVKVTKNGLDVPGMATTIDTTADTAVAIPVTGIFRNCGCECNAMLALMIDAPCTVTGISVTAEKL